MADNKVDLASLDAIIKKTIDAIENSKKQIYDIAEGARRECKRLEQELAELKVKVRQIIEDVDIKEAELKESKRRLMLLSQKFQNRSEEQLKAAYELADALRIQLAVKREQEQNFIFRRNELEIRLKEAIKTVEKADNLISQIGTAMGYLSNNLVDLSSQLVDMQNRQNMGYKIIQAQEEERQRVAREIHDGPAQSMSNVVLKAEICEKLMDIDAERSRSELKSLKTVVRVCLQDVRRIIYDLRPMSLDDLGLVPTIQRYVSNFKEEVPVEVIFRTSGDSSQISSVIALTAFRIIQEAFSNIKKYAHAQCVTVSMTFSEDILFIHIFDDGDGFNIEEVNKRHHDVSSGFGLYSMRERVELLGGKFELRSNLGKGTRLNIAIPLTTKGDEENGKDSSAHSR